MENRNEKSEEIVKSIKLLESVFKSSSDRNQKSRVKRDINKLREKLKEIYPDSNLKEIENAIYSEIMAIPSKEEKSIKKHKFLKNIIIEIISPYKEDLETNEAAGIMKYFEEKIWVVLSEQHTKLDFSNSGERDSLNRKLDECNRAFKTFCQTMEDIDKARSNEYLSQLQLMRVRHGRLFLFEIHGFFKSVHKFISNLINSINIGGNMVLNPDDKISYADYEEYATYEDWIIVDALKNVLKFIEEVLKFVNIPDIKQF